MEIQLPSKGTIAGCIVFAVAVVAAISITVYKAVEKPAGLDQTEARLALYDAGFKKVKKTQHSDDRYSAKMGSCRLAFTLKDDHIIFTRVTGQRMPDPTLAQLKKLPELQWCKRPA